MRKTLFRNLANLQKHSPTFLLAMWFFILLLAGTVLLALPVSHLPGGPKVTPFDALFTAVSAFCVTGLVTVDTHDAFSFFGQFIIMVLIELGGVGIMTFAALAFSIMSRRLSMVGQAALADALLQNDAALEFRVLFRCMLKAVILVQLAGVAALFLALWAKEGTGGDTDIWYMLWSAIFHSVSAFCNAGFSTYRNNLVFLADNRPFLIIIAALVIVGGLGHGVLAELYRLPNLLRKVERKPRWLTLNSRVVLLATSFLLVAGGILVAATDCFYGPAGLGGIGDSVFHSVVARTAGFNSGPLDALPLPSCVFLCLLMFVGGSPGSCAGGVKTTSLAIWLARIGSNLRHDTHVTILGYTISPHLVSKARLIMALSTVWVVFGIVLLSLLQPEIGLNALLFEQISAFATVGLSMGLTPNLNVWSQLWLIISMIMGKFGPLTIALWLVPSVQGKVTRPEGRLMIG